jgi:hypothetical protein
MVCRGWGKQGIAPESYRARTPFNVAPVKAIPAVEAFDKVLAGGGATRPKRDAVDLRIVAEVTSKTGKIIDSPAEVGGYPKLTGGTPPVDSDHDGMPDDWEKQKGLDPKNPRDATQDRDGDGYTNIEEYLHWLAR